MQLLALEVDSTGYNREREMILLSVFSPIAYFNQYIMPQRDLNPIAAKKYGLEIVENKRVRKLKDSESQKIIATKSCKHALRQFIKWLQEIGQGSDGIILFTFDRRKAAISMLLQSLEKYRMTEKFSTSVRGFVVLQDAAKTAFKKMFVSYTMKTLSRLVLNLAEEPVNAPGRSIVSFQLMARLFGGRQYNLMENRETFFVRTLANMGEYTQSVPNEIERLKVEIRMYSLKPLLMGNTQVEKGRLYSLRKYLAESEVDYMLLTATYRHKGKDGIDALIRTKLSHMKAKQIQLLKKALEQHFENDL